MKRTRQHEIDDEAQVILKAALPKSWVCGKHDKDYAKDYYVELVENTELTGKAFLVQLKGTERLKTIKGGSLVSFSLETNYVLYYADKVEMPVFLVVADVVSKRAYWLFVQDHVDKALDPVNPHWRKQKSATLRVPIGNDLADTSRFRHAVDSAIAYMKKKYPGRIEDAVAREKERMEKLDPRILLQVGVADGRVVYTMNAKEDIYFNFHLSGDKESVAAKHRDLVEQGRLVDLTEIDASISGLPSMQEGGRIVQAQFQRRLPMEIRIALLKEDGTEILRLDPIVGDAAGGTKETRFREPLGQSILNAHLTVTLHDAEPRTRLNGTFSFDMGRWGGRNVSTLPFFDQVVPLVRHLNLEGLMSWTVTTQGNKLFEFRGRLPVYDAIRQVGVYCDIFVIAREVSNWSGIDPVVPASISPDETDDLFRLSELLDPGRRVVPYPDKELILELPREKVRSELDSGRSPFGGSGVAKVVPSVPVLSFLGVPVEVYGFSVEISEVFFQQTDGDMRRWLDSTTEPVARVVALSRPNATLTKTFEGVRQFSPPPAPSTGRTPSSSE